MKKLPILTLLLISSLSHASPLVGFSTLEPENKYKILNAQKETIFEATADTVKQVALRDGFAVVQTSSENVSLIREDQSIPIDSIYGAEFKVSNKLLAIYNVEGNGAVYNLDGTRVYPAEGAPSRSVSYILISNTRFAVMDANTQTLTVYDASGAKINSFLEIKRALISDGFLVLLSELDSLTIYGTDLSSSIANDSNVSQIQISDQFAGYVDYYGNLRLFSRTAGEFPSINNIGSFSLTNTFALVHDSFGLTLYGKDKAVLEIPTSQQSFSVSHALYAYTGNTGALWIKNEETGDSFVVNYSDFYSMSDDLLVVKNGKGDFQVYSLQSGSFGNSLYSDLDQTIDRFQAGNGIVSFQTSLATSASNSAKVLELSAKGTETIQSVLVDETRVGKVDLSVNREEWNWQ